MQNGRQNKEYVKGIENKRNKRNANKVEIGKEGRTTEDSRRGI